MVEPRSLPTALSESVCPGVTALAPQAEVKITIKMTRGLETGITFSNRILKLADKHMCLQGYHRTEATGRRHGFSLAVFTQLPDRF